MDETYLKVADDWAYAYRALDEQGQVVDVHVSAERVTAGAATYPPALAAVLLDILHKTGKLPQQRIERDHQHLKGYVREMRGFKTIARARVVCRAHLFLRNLRRGFYGLEQAHAATSLHGVPAMVSTWEALTAGLLTW